jgi:hypothetical protein
MYTRLTKTMVGLLLVGGWSAAALHADNFGVSFGYSSHGHHGGHVQSYSFGYCAPSFRYYEPRTYVYAPPTTYVYSAPVAYVAPAPTTYVVSEPRTYVYPEPTVYVSPSPSVVVYDDPIYTTTYTRSDCFSYPTPSAYLSLRFGGDRHYDHDRHYDRDWHYDRDRRHDFDRHDDRDHHRDAPFGGFRITGGDRDRSRRTIEAPRSRPEPRRDIRDSRSSIGGRRDFDRGRGIDRSRESTPERRQPAARGGRR